VSSFDPLNSGGSLMFQSFGIPHGRLGEHFLKFPPVVKRLLHSRYEFVGNINGDSFPFHPHIQEMAGVLFPFQAGLAVFTDAGAPTQTERAQGSGPEVCSMIPEPLLDVCRRFAFGWHIVCMPYSLHIVKQNPLSVMTAIDCEFCDRN